MEKPRKDFNFSPALRALRAIKDKEGEKRNLKGTIPCPECGEEAHYTIASNGHVHARCAKGCFCFMQ